MQLSIFQRSRDWYRLRRVFGVWLAVSLALGTVVVPEAWAADYYVDPGTGNDANAGTAAAPWKTLTHALGQVAASDVIHLAPGTYDSPTNGETFALALVDGVTILGDTANPASVVISAPAGSNVFFNDDTPLGSSTRLAGVTLKHDADTSTPMMEFAVDTAAMAPSIDHNVFAGSVTESNDEGISYYDDGSGDGVFTPTIDNNTFTDLYTGIWMYDLESGAGNDFSPVITNNTFTDTDYPISYTMSSYLGGTVGGLVQGNSFTGTTYQDIYIYFSAYYGSENLLFNPTITGNDLQSGASTNVYAGVYGYSHAADATFAPTITGNQMDASERNIAMSGYYQYIDGDYTFAPIISGNTMTGADSEAISMSLTTLSVSSSSQRNVFSPTITNNTITPGSGGYGISIQLSDWSYGRLEGTATIAGNTITNADDGIFWDMSSMSDGTGMDWSIVISNNTITNPSSDGISFDMGSMSFSGTGTFGLTVEGNTVTDASWGIYMYPAYSWYSDNTLTETVLVRGNTVTGSANDGLHMYFSDQTSNTLDARITGNVLQNNGTGLGLESNDLGSNGILVACNTITGNTGNGVEQDDGNDPPADYGGGNLASPGGNVIMNNGGFDFLNADDATVMAENNWWGSTTAATIDSHIRDDDEGSYGAVDFEPFLASAPTQTIGATLTDAVSNDVPPAGASVGDTLLYTAVISAAGTCADASVTFTAPVDANTSVVPGSVTTTRGIVQSEDPPTVAVGFVDGSGPVTITWQVIVNGGTQVQTQGTVNGTLTGSTLTDDPDVGGSTDPTVTRLTTLASPGIPTLGQWGAMLFAALLLLLGGWMLRRRWAGAAVGLLLMAGMAAAPAWAGDEAKPNAKELHATTVASFTLARDTATLTLADGSSFSVPRAAFDVRPGHVKRAKGEARPQSTREERRQLRIARRAASSRAARLGSLQAGTPVLVTVKLHKRDGTIKRIKVLTFDTLEQAQAELARKRAGKKRHRK